MTTQQSTELSSKALKKQQVLMEFIEELRHRGYEGSHLGFNYRPGIDLASFPLNFCPKHKGKTHMPFLIVLEGENAGNFMCHECGWGMTQRFADGSKYTPRLNALMRGFLDNDFSVLNNKEEEEEDTPNSEE
jgi:hypothetical protein